MKTATNNVTLIISIALLVFTLLPILAPIFAHFGIEPLADVIYWAYQWTCHQRPWRSYHLFDYQYALDARMTLIFASMAIGSFIVYFKKIRPLKRNYIILLLLVSALPMAIDGIAQAIAELRSSNSLTIPIYESTNFVRSVTGLILGTGVAFSIIPLIDLKNVVKEKEDFQTILKYVALDLVISLSLIFLITFFWGLTSKKYKPSSTFIDNEKRIPGYNYEITTEGGHTTIDRIFKLPASRYLERAEKYEKYELINEYEGKK